MSNSIKKLSNLQVSSLFKGFFEFKKLRFSHSLYQGGQTPIIDRELFARGQAVVVLLFDSVQEQVVLVEQCRVGAIQHALESNCPANAWLQEPVAGMIDQGETPQQAAIREVFEETGYQIDSAENLEYITHFYPSPGACDEILWLYAAEIDSLKLNEFSGLSEEHEDIRVVTLPYKDAKQQLAEGRLNVSSTIIALQWLFYYKA